VRLLLDINVVLDVALKRMPFVADSATLLTAVDQGDAVGFVATHTITTSHYVIAKNQGVLSATAAVSQLLRIVGRRSGGSGGLGAGDIHGVEGF